MEVVLILGLTWLALATGVVGLCAAAHAADAQTDRLARPRPRRRARRRVPPGRRPGCAPAALQRRSRSL